MSEVIMFIEAMTIGILHAKIVNLLVQASSSYRRLRSRDTVECDCPRSVSLSRSCDM